MNQKPQSWWTTITFAAAGAVLIGFFSSREEGISTSELWLTGLVSFSVLFVTMRLSDRLTRMAFTRFGPKPRQAPPKGDPLPEARTERPSHVSRRRQQRRPRGGPRKR
ncbi:MAG: hypothetical protein EPO16_10445 [Dehalococcoidia bacterium]|nr:MAG: hypothetical protein EPO16_10445 [Dehalococcoidia bacterium]